MYFTVTRPDLTYNVSLVSKYMCKPTELHLQAVKRILRYLKGTLNYRILCKRENSNLIAYTNSDYTGDLDDRKITSGYVFLIASGVVSLLSKKQPVVTSSTIEVEFVTAVGCASQTVWMRRISEQLGCVHNQGTLVYCDNSSTIKLFVNPVLYFLNKGC